MERSKGLRKMHDGVKVFCRRWASEKKSKGMVLLVHGGAEHSGRYEHVAEKLVKTGYEVLGFDLRGFGQTEGQKGHLRYSGVFKDMDELLAEEREKDIPIFLLGHSLGGQLALLYCLDRRPDIVGVVATGPALHISSDDQKLETASRILGLIFPKIAVTLPIDDTKLMSDSKALQDFRSDPLVHFRGTFGMGRDWYLGLERVLAEASQFPLPLLLVHAKEDAIALPSGSEEFAAKHPGDCTLKTYERVYHDFKWEPEWESIFEDIVAWLDDHQTNCDRPGGSTNRKQ